MKENQAADQYRCAMIPFKEEMNTLARLCLFTHVFMQIRIFVFKNCWIFPQVLAMAIWGVGWDWEVRGMVTNMNSHYSPDFCIYLNSKYFKIFNKHIFMS